MLEPFLHLSVMWDSNVLHTDSQKVPPNHTTYLKADSHERVMEELEASWIYTGKQQASSLHHVLGLRLGSPSKLEFKHLTYEPSGS